MKAARGSNRGFTLVEVMVLLVIIAFLLAMAIMSYQRIRQSRQEKAAGGRVSDVAIARGATAESET